MSSNNISEEFQVFGIKANDDIVSKCEILSSQYGLDAENLVVHWLSYSTNKGYTSVTLEVLDYFEKEYLSKKKNSSSSAALKPKPVKNVVSSLPGLTDEDDFIISAYGGSPAHNKLKSRLNEGTPDRNNKSPVTTPQSVSAKLGRRMFENSPIPQGLSPNVSQRSQRYIGRANSGAIVLSYQTNGQSNDDLSSKIWKAKPYGVSATVSGLDNSADNKMMFDKLYESADLEEEAILHIADEIAPAFGDGDCWHYMDNTSNIPINSIGRICCDSNGKLNAASILMEGTRKFAGAVMQRLDLSKLDKFAVFPGQIVGVTGINIVSDRLIADNLIGGRVLPLPENQITINKETGPIQMVVAGGPFTTSDNLLFEPLADLLSSISDEPPHILLLLGPMLDASHPLLGEASTTETFQDIINRVMNMITSTLTKTSTEVYIVASHKDVTGTGIYPAMPLSGPSHPRLHLVSDPSMIEVEGVVVAVTTMDVIMDLSKEELAYPPAQGDRMARLVHHILAQQNMYPLSPAPSHVSVSPLLLQRYASVNCKPHVLIVPSDIRHFAKEVADCVAVNPERLCKGTSGGFYARIELNCPVEDDPFKPSVTAAIYRV